MTQTLIKPIGYKSPINIKAWDIVKGDIFKPDIQEGYYICTTKAIGVPIELAETWEAVYEEDEDIFIDEDIVRFVLHHAIIKNQYVSKAALNALYKADKETIKKIIDRVEDLSKSGTQKQ